MWVYCLGVGRTELPGVVEAIVLNHTHGHTETETHTYTHAHTDRNTAAAANQFSLVVTPTIRQLKTKR